nr:chloroplast glutamine synthetase [Tanacetum cinerariifolium]
MTIFSSGRDAVVNFDWTTQFAPSDSVKRIILRMVKLVIMKRITKMAGVILSFDLKPVCGDWNGAGVHTNYSVLQNQ